MKVKLDRRALVRLGLQSSGVKDLVYGEGEKRRQRLAGSIGGDKVASYAGGVSRARYTLRRLEPLKEESKDGLLSRVIRGGL